MINKKYYEDFKIRTYDADFLQKLSPIALLSYLAEVATLHANELGLGYEESWNNDFFWILRSSKFDLYRVPKLFETVRVYTWPAGMHGLKSLRKFEIYVGEELIGKGYHYWLMMNHKLHKPIISEYFLDKIKNMEINTNDFFKLDKIKTPEIMDLMYNVTIRPKDIDWNMHVNNVRYSDIVYNAIPLEILKANDIVSLQIDYLKECKLEDNLDVYYKQVDNHIYIDGRIEDCSMFKTIIEIR